MKQGFIKTAAATPRITVADCRANGEEILRLIRKMAKEHAKLMVFPELCITGYTCQDLFLQRRLLESAKNTLLWLARETKETDALIWVGLPVCFEGKLYNAAAALNRGKILGIVPKVHLPNYGEFYEQRHFARGNEKISYLELGGEEIPFGTNMIFCAQEMPEFTVSAEICEDLWVPVPPSVRHAVAGAHIIVNLSASNEMVGKESYRRKLVSGQSARLVCGYIYANAGEGESTQDLVFGGQNMIAENGVMLAEGKRFENDIIFGEIDVRRLSDERRRLSTFPAEDYSEYLRISFKVREE